MRLFEIMGLLGSFSDLLLARAQSSFLARCGAEGFDPVADVDDSGLVDISDATLVVSRISDFAWCDASLSKAWNGACP